MKETQIKEIPPETRERINTIFRPVDDVCECRVMAAFLDFLETQETEEERIAVLAYALSVRYAAHLSGPETFASEYPEFEQHIDHKATDGVHEGLQYTLTMLELEFRPTAATVAAHAWKLLTPFRTRATKLHALAHIFDDLVTKIEDPTIPLVHDRGLPDQEYNAIIWKHRQRIDTMVASMEKSESVTGVGEAVLTIAAEIPDERERACVVGFAVNAYMRLRQAQSSSGTGLDDALKSLVASIIGKKPTHVCGVVIIGPKPK